MKIVLQRVRSARVTSDGKVKGEIGPGLCLLVGIEKGDDERAAAWAADKIVGLRVFPDSRGRMNLSVTETGGEILAVSQFTLAGSVRKGRRPSFDGAEDPSRARGLFDGFVARLRAEGVSVSTGIFGAMMEVDLINDGPVTFIVEPPARAGAGGGRKASG